MAGRGRGVGVRWRAVGEAAAPVISGSSLVSGGLAFNTTQPGDLYYSYEASATPLTGAQIETAALVPATDQTAYIGIGATNTTLLNYPVAAGTYYLQYVIKNADGLYSNVVVEPFTVVVAALTLVQSLGIDGDGAAGTTTTFTIAPGITNGDLLVVCAAFGAGTISTIPSGWTEVGRAAQAVAGWMIVIKKIAASDSSAVLTFTTSVSTVGCATFIETIAPVGTVEVQFNSVTTDPPSISPAAGSGEYIWGAAAVLERGTGDFTVAPSGYTNMVKGFSTVGAAAGGERKIGFATKKSTATSEDPGTFTHSAHTQEGAITLAIQ